MRGCAIWGQRCDLSIPYDYWKTTRFMAGLCLVGMIAPVVQDGPMFCNTLITYGEQMLVPEQREGDIIIMVNLLEHKVKSI